MGDYEAPSTPAGLPTTTTRTTNIPVNVQVRYARTPTIDNRGPAEHPTVMQLWEQAKTRWPTKEALHWKDAATNVWQNWTWQQYYDNVIACAKSFIKLGLEPGKAVAIIGFNSKEWFVADFATIFAGGLVSGIYTTNSAEQIQYICENSESQVMVCENTKQLLKVLAVKHKLPELKAIIVYNNKIECDVAAELAKAQANEASTSEENAAPVSGEKLVWTWDEAMALASQVPQETLQERINKQKITDCCTLIYTSGTTGNPKGVMISHYNISFTIASIIGPIGITQADRIVTYLPLSHIAEQIVSLHAPLSSGAAVYFAEPTALQGTLVETLKHVRPTIFVGVPRVWEKIQAKIMSAGAQNTGLKKAISTWARGKGMVGNYNAQNGIAKPWGWWLAQRLVFNKVSNLLGLDQARVCITTAAPISKDTLEFFLSLNIPICEVFGMSEATGPITLSVPYKYKTAKAGWPIHGTEIKIAEDGEVCFRGGNVFMGYWKNPTATAETIDDHGWLHTGDVGVLDEHGFLQITDRKKELIITAGGENVPPAVLEGYLRGIPLVNQAVVIGDRRKFIGALISLNTDRLKQEAAAIGATCGDDPTLAAKDPVFLAHMKKLIGEVNKQLSNAQAVKNFAILPNELTIEGDELTPTMKLKRRIINTKYADLIESVYAGSE